MKRTAAILLALVIVFALVGCDVATRTYRRYPTGRTTHDSTIGTTYGTARSGAYRAQTGVRIPNTSSDTLNKADFNRGGVINPGGPYTYNAGDATITRGVNPSAKNPVITPEDGTLQGATGGTMTRQGLRANDGTVTQNNAKTNVTAR